MVAATDSRRMGALADQIYRFSPVRAQPEHMGRFHGTNERISIDNYGLMLSITDCYRAERSRHSQADRGVVSGASRECRVVLRLTRLTKKWEFYLRPRCLSSR